MILIIDNYDSFTYNLYQSVAVLHEDVRVIRNDQILVAEVLNMKPSLIILSPGPGRPEDAGICVALIRAVAQHPVHIPVFGVCLGLQAMALAFGGKIVQAPVVMHGKQDFIFHQRQGIYQNLPLPFQAGRYHSLMVERETLPQPLHIEAEDAHGTIMGLRHASRPIQGVQFHPESILTPLGPHLFSNLLKQGVTSC